MTARYARQIALFGEEGQRRIAAAHVAIAGVGGLGSHLVQQLAYLGVLKYTLADDDTVEDTNLNRLIGAVATDVGETKVAIASRLIKSVQPEASIVALTTRLPDATTPAAFASATVVIGAFDRETPRLALTDWCSTAGVPYIDVATDVIPTETGPQYGGRVVVANGQGCLSCLDLIDQTELAREAMTMEQRQAHDTIYGISKDDLAGSGPSVVTLNGVVASLAATELMCLLTGVRPPRIQLTYYGNLGSVRPSNDPGRDDCPFCLRWRTRATDLP
jgi:molybdopterin-synthase adenylyltransferase